MSIINKLAVVATVAMLHAPVVFSTNPHHVPGESLDSGLGQLPADYTAAEYQYRVPGESLDSGLGELSASYNGAEFFKVPGESQDSGLGELPADYTAAEYQREPIRSADASDRM